MRYADDFLEKLSFDVQPLSKQYHSSDPMKLLFKRWNIGIKMIFNCVINYVATRIGVLYQFPGQCHFLADKSIRINNLLKKLF